MPAVFSRVFMNGNSQALRIPQESRLDTGRVQIGRDNEGDLVIHPVPADRGRALLQALQAFDDVPTQDIVARLEEDRFEPVATQERDAL